MKYFKRVLSIICMLAMLTSMMPVVFANTETECILSGNAATITETEQYAEMTVASTGAMYEYSGYDVALDDTGASASDTGTAELTDGTVNGYQVTGTFINNPGSNGSNKYISVVFDLGKFYPITGVDVWARAKYTAIGISQTIISVSNDNVNFEEIGRGGDNNYSADVTYDTDPMKQTFASVFNATAPVTTKYVKVTLERPATANNIQFNEIVIRGYDAPDELLAVKIDAEETLNKAKIAADEVCTDATRTEFVNAKAALEDLIESDDVSAIEAANAALEAAIGNLAVDTVKYPEAILSANAATITEVEQYAEMSVVDNDAAYEYSGYDAALDDTGASANDTGTAELTDGTVNGYQVTGTFINNPGSDGSNKYISVVFDLGVKRPVSGVDVWARAKHPAIGISQTIISVSNDNVNFEEIGRGGDNNYSADVTYDTDPMKQTYTSVFNADIAVMTRYIKVTVERPATANNIQFNEIVIRGYDYIDRLLVAKESAELLLEKANDIASEIYTLESLSVVSSKKEALSALVGSDAATADDVYAAITELEAAIAELDIAYSEAILSGNASTITTVDQYSQMYVVPGATYGYSGYNEKLDDNRPKKETDKDCTLLLDGITAGYQVEGTFISNPGSDGSNKYISVVFDLGKKRPVSGVDVWARAKHPAIGISQTIIAVSDDNVNFEEIGRGGDNNYSADVTYDSDAMKQTYTSVFDADIPVRTRYVKVTMERPATANNIQFNEIVIRGYDVSAPEVKFSISDLEFYDEADTKLDVLQNRIETLCINGSVINRTDEDKRVTVIAALYNGSGAMKKVGFVPCDTTAGQPTPFELVIENLDELGDLTNYSLKIMVWEGFTSIIPLSHYESFPE